MALCVVNRTIEHAIICQINIKEGYFIGATNRSEAQRSVLGIIRAHTLREVNNRCVAAANDRKLKGNKNCSGGRKGDEGRLKNKSKEEDKKTRINVRGSFKATELLRYLDEINEDQTNRDDENHKTLMESLSKRNLSWSEKRKEKIINRYREKSKKGKKMNKNQQRQSVLHTDITLGPIAYSSIRAEFADVIKTELKEAYGIDYSDSDAKIKELIRNSLKKEIIEQHGKE